MKKVALLFICILLSQSWSFAQQKLSETEKLASLAKVYGFLKYYHPEVSKGKFDWDQQCLQTLPKVLEAVDKESLSQIYLNWIGSLGSIKKCKRCDAKKKYFDKNFDLSWTQDPTLFNKELQRKFSFIKNNRNQKSNHYVTTEAVGNIVLTNESDYKNESYPNEAIRLLGLFNYWNIIEYFYPYKYLTDQNWNDVLREIIPKIREASDQATYQNVLKELITKLDDSHAWINFDPNQKNKFLPVIVAHVEGKAVVYDYYNMNLAQESALKLGDIILEVDGNNVQTEMENILKYVPGSNLTYKQNRAYSKIFNGAEDTIELTIERDGKTKAIQVQKYDRARLNYTFHECEQKSKSISETIGYVDMTCRYNPKELKSIFDSFKSKKSVIVDLRGYPELRYKMYTRYFNSKKTVFAMKYRPDISYPGRFIIEKGIETGSSRDVFKGKFVLLVNQNSISLSEFTAMAFQTAENIITVGNETAGADGRTIVINYLGGYRTAFSGYGIMYPDGTASQRKGVKIDIEVHPTIEGLKNNRDEILEKAIQVAKD